MHIRLWGRVILLSKKKCAFFLVLLLIICTIIGYILVKSGDNSTAIINEPTQTVIFLPDATVCPTPTSDPGSNILYAIHITGCVTTPGVVYVPPDSILYDAIQLCGGFSDNADTQSANLAVKLKDGMQIRIPAIEDKDKTWLLSPGTDSTDGTQTGSESGENVKVNINTASMAQLMTLSGIGESTAKSIIDYRNKNGPFRKAEDIMNVPGIKEGKYNKIKDDITVSS